MLCEAGTWHLAIASSLLRCVTRPDVQRLLDSRRLLDALAQLLRRVPIPLRSAQKHAVHAADKIAPARWQGLHAMRARAANTANRALGDVSCEQGSGIVVLLADL